MVQFSTRMRNFSQSSCDNLGAPQVINIFSQISLHVIPGKNEPNFYSRIALRDSGGQAVIEFMPSCRIASCPARLLGQSVI